MSVIWDKKVTSDKKILEHSVADTALRASARVRDKHSHSVFQASLPRNRDMKHPVILL